MPTPRRHPKRTPDPHSRPEEDPAMAAEHDHSHDHSHDHGDAALARIEALRDEGVHRAGDHEGPFSLHVLGLGKTGADLITSLVTNQPDGFLSEPGTRFSALAVDIGDEDLAQVRDAAGSLPTDRSFVRTVAMPVPTNAELSYALNRYREFLKMEYPRYYWNPNYEPWLPADVEIAPSDGHYSRAVAKAIYGSEYYQGGEIAEALDDFAASVLSSEATPLVVVAFSLAGGVGSGIVVEIARHLSSIKLGRRPWVVGLGILPNNADPAEYSDGSLFPVINELDCMIDAEKNKGVMAVWGDLYKNPFTGGFFLVDQNDVQDLTGDLAATHEYLDTGIGSFLARDASVHLYETLKALNWLAVPADAWHPAIRGEQGDRWINMLSVRKLADIDTLGATGLVKGFSTEYVEARAFGAPGKKAAAAIAKAVSGVAASTVEPAVLELAGADDLVSVVLPRASKLDLAAFVPARDYYDTLEWDDKLLIHSWLLDLGVMLCEPSIRFDGMGGECIWGCACWVVVPHAAIRGEVSSPIQVDAADALSAN
ncbi:tubulin-like doman-containing protein [Actinomycetospora endophytica]|uniref:Tubulin-like doman-containing protein n=1 Tax=Actinomycetospora endophytica TaxID=2291215 RepID=A0ABS8P6K4_9PSEU|nr:tubulin-like doman-containing protein [Actinomycetospora endophytica]MCD2193663.1 tubulin-like doman-containing protein [Actinomycetospora endophytica]